MKILVNTFSIYTFDNNCCPPSCAVCMEECAKSSCFFVHDKQALRHRECLITFWKTPLTLSVLSDVYVRQCTIQAGVHICCDTAGSSEIIIQGRIVSAAENNKNR